MRASDWGDSNCERFQGRADNGRKNGKNGWQSTDLVTDCTDEEGIGNQTISDCGWLMGREERGGLAVGWCQ
jgi:hypothetical protein